MLWVARYGQADLYLGDHRDALNLSARKKHDIGALLTVMHDKCPIVPAEKHLVVPMVDGPGCKPEQFAEAVDFLCCAHRAQEYNTLVHCWSGISRSVAVLTAYLWTHPDCYLAPELSEALKQTPAPAVIAEWLRFCRGAQATLSHPVVWQAMMEFIHEGQHEHVFQEPQNSA